MQFDLPANKTEMYNTLQQIYYNYRIKKETFEGVTLQPLTLARKETINPDDDELIWRASVQTVPAQALRKIKEDKEYEEKIKEIEWLLDCSDADASADIRAITTAYNNAKLSVEREATKRGLANSDIVAKRLLSLEAEKEIKIAQINADSEKKKQNLRVKLFMYTDLRNKVNTRYSTLEAQETSAVLDKLKLERKEKRNEILAYNNTVTEKEQESINKVNETLAKLSLQHQEIKAVNLTKDELIEMGYYDDVIRCVCGYYDTLTPANAWTDISSESKLIVYLDDYYQSVVYMYKTRAGV